MNRPHGSKIEQKLLIETGMQKVLGYLVLYPEKEFSLTDLAKESGVRKSNIGNILDKLYKEEIIIVEKLAKIWRIRANQGSTNFIKIKVVYNMHHIYQSGMVEFLNEKYGNPKSIILFGSFRRGEDTSKSDIDIAIEMEDAKEYKIVELEKEIMGRKTNLHLFNRKVIDKNLFNNIANGIVLSGFLEVRP